jgi:preprotein translocase subunit YajC
MGPFAFDAVTAVRGPVLAQQAGTWDMINMFWPILAIGVMFYVLLVLPERRKRAETTKMQDSLKKNDRVLLMSGIIGVVVNAQKGDGLITVRVDESNNTRIDVLRSSILKVLGDDKSGGDKEGVKAD